MVPEAQVGWVVTAQVPQLQAPGAVGPSTTSAGGEASKPVGQAGLCEGVNATSDHPGGTVMQPGSPLVQAVVTGGPSSGGTVASIGGGFGGPESSDGDPEPDPD